ncbi:hypothetical protein E8E12_009149 [Didymella heteroderae]|uniref:Transmembrane protein n=1 Tax=Didymella heteroderae TaxID=1769908 RepID=A0A9P4WTU8_9PLEO|nr:hypothetical protein E8E12_009149 [Didymella heteroderae]
MAYHWIGRNEDDRKSKYYPKSTSTATDTDDGDDYSTSTIVDELSSGTPVVPQLEVPPSITGPPPAPTPLDIYPPAMSNRPPGDQSQGVPGDDWPWTTGPPPWATQTGYNGDNRGRPSSTITTSYSKSSAYPDQNGLGSTPTPTPTPIQSETSPAKPTDDDLGLENHGANSGSNKTPTYVAGGAVPVVVIIIGICIFFCLRKRRRQRQAAAVNGHVEEMKMQPKPVERPYIAPITPPSPPPQAALPQYSPSTPSSSHPPTASSSQPVILGPIPSGQNGAYLTGMDTSDLVSMRSGGVSRQGTVVDRDPFADGRSLEEAPPPYRPSSLPPASLASTSRNSSVRMAAPPHMTSRTQLIERSPFDDPEDDEVSDISGPTLRRETDAMSDVSELSYQMDPVFGRSPF